MDPGTYTGSMIEPLQKSSDLTYVSIGSVNQNGPADRGHEFKLMVHSLIWVPSGVGSLDHVCTTAPENAEIRRFTADESVIYRCADCGLSSSAGAVEYSSQHKFQFATTRNDDSSKVARQQHSVIASPVQPQSLYQPGAENLLASFTESAGTTGYFSLPGIQEP
ncbi:hypothetical protein P879_05276 [Paragonimus westermani]|uniref:Uncharacterized protein n=1 Tax=Paragonimus westermani TaxID=34504 RepID=A0A8T0DQ11_9TREM|nr:hypothetical protein P879_05276 [Paragonimus westermani]